jgi:hypothetical protein
MNFFSVVIKFINTYFLTYTLSNSKQYIPTNYKQTITNSDKYTLNENASISNIISDIL